MCQLPDLKEKPNFYSQKLQLPELKEDLVKLKWSGEWWDFSGVYSTMLQNACKRVENAYKRFVRGDKNGTRSGKPRFKSQSRYRTLVFDGAKNNWLKFCTINGRWLYLNLPKLGLVKVRSHRPLPVGFTLKQVSVIRKAYGWYVTFVLNDERVREHSPDSVIPTWITRWDWMQF